MLERPSNDARGRVIRKTVSDGWRGDAGDRLLRDLRVETSVLCRSIMAAPWGFGVDGRPVGAFHMLVKGDGWLEVDGVPEPTPLRQGDVVVLPRGSAHRVTDDPSTAAPPLDVLLAQHDVENGELHFGGTDGPMSEIVCGTFSIDGPWPPPWATLVPPIIRTAGDAGPPWRARVVAALRTEARAPTTGGSVVVNRLLETLIGDALLGALDPSSGAAGALDPRIAPAVAAIMERPEAPWTIDRLARRAAMSRSVFSARFRSRTGMSPMRYLSEVRLARASRLLRSTDRTIEDIGRSIGYASESAFSRAFKDRFGEPPGEFRRSGRSGASAHAEQRDGRDERRRP